MSIGEYCNREVVVAESHTEILEAAKLMRNHHVGDLVVVERRGDILVPVGIVTDRDLVVEVLAQELDPNTVTLADIMTADLVTAREDDELWLTLGRMRSQGIRRLPVVTGDGQLVGILTADDVLELLADGLTDLARLVKREREYESRSRP